MIAFGLVIGLMVGACLGAIYGLDRGEKIGRENQRFIDATKKEAR